MGDHNLNLQNQTSNIFNESHVHAVNNTTDTDDSIISDTDFDMYGIFMQIIPSLGIVGNVLSFVVSIQLAKSSSFYLYFAVLALSDTAGLIFLGIGIFLDVPVSSVMSKTDAPSICSLPIAMALTFCQLSSWIVVAVSIDRHIAVNYPCSLKKYCTRKRTLLNMAVAFLGILSLNLPVVCLQWNDDYSSCVMFQFTYYYCSKFTPYVDMFCYNLIPFCLISIFNILIVRGIYKAGQRRHSLTSSSTNNMANSSKKQITMLFTVTTFFILTLLPCTFVNLYTIFYDKTLYEIIHLIPFAASVIDVSLLLNHSCNLIMYGLAGQRYRKKFAEIFCFRCFVQR